MGAFGTPHETAETGERHLELFEKIGKREDLMSFSSMLKRIGSTVTLVRDAPNGELRVEVLASIQKGKAFFDITTDVEEGDLIEQKIPSGKLVTHRVTDVTHHQAPAHFSRGSHIEADIEKFDGSAANSVRSARTREIARRDREPLRILYMTAAQAGDLRVDREVRAVREAVRAATHRDMVDIEPLPAATGSDLLNGLTRFRPHAIHFSGHGNESVLSFDAGETGPAHGYAMAADTFVGALRAVDHPPRLVVLNACKSEAQLETLTSVASVAVGMSGSIGDSAAISFAARFYSSIAEGQSVASALALSKVELSMAHVADADLPTLKAASGVNPATVVLVA
ncbi:CHAT domain-containing protein [Actinoplanes sp. NPDC049265]|uniref:CHAT domain-containing protein n=1 Tax=Actinoplanes sp. NPDC049265 TaxID=3363902 RepID=UPI00371E8A8B